MKTIKRSGAAVLAATMWICAAGWGYAQAPAEDAAGKDTWPGVRLKPEAGTVEIDAKVVLDKAEWLELIVCTAGSREYESILATTAKPSHIHLALVALGLEPGHPMSWKEGEDGKLIQIVPQGPAVEVTLVFAKDGRVQELPANQLIKSSKTDKPMPGNTWLFTGSQFVEHEGQRIYMADLNGTVISLVNFGDDLLARDTKLTNQTDDGEWVANTDGLPPAGSPIMIRLKPVKAEAKTPDESAEKSVTP